MNEIRQSCQWVVQNAEYVSIDEHLLRTFAEVVITKEKGNIHNFSWYQIYPVSESFDMNKALLPVLLSGMLVGGIFVKTWAQVANWQYNASFRYYLLFSTYYFNLINN